MSLVEGIGDEVLEFFGAVVIISLALIAWWSTNISEAPLIRTVLILERRTRGRATVTSDASAHAQSPVTSDSNESAIDTGQVVAGDLPELVNVERNVASGNSSGDKDDNESSSSLLLPNSHQPPTEPSNPEMPSPEPAPTPEAQPDAEPVQNSSNETSTDADSTILRRRRLAFFQSRGPTLIEAPEAPESVEVNEVNAEEDTSTNPDHIRIRLKYLNDDQIVVQGKLHEQLGDFKRRHFRIELAAEKMVRLIFNGQVLQSDSQTLQGYGLFDNCVVHCLVHTQRTIAQRSAQTQSNSSSNTSTTPPDWNLGTLLYTCISVILGFAWYCRYEYSHLFTVTTTTALFGLSSMFVLTLFSVYMPDQENIQ